MKKYFGTDGIRGVANETLTPELCYKLGRVLGHVLSEENNVIDVLYSVFQSFISDEISDFNSSVYYSTPEYLKYSYLEGKLLA